MESSSTEFGSSIAIQIYDHPLKKFSKERDFKSTKKWDVIEAQPYGFMWSGSDAMQSHFRILRLSNIPLQEALEWIKPMMVYDILVQKRMYYIAGESPEAKWLRDVCAMGYMLELDLGEQMKLKGLIRERPSPIAINGYSNH